jgi:hypothetical protein
MPINYTPFFIEKIVFDDILLHEITYTVQNSSPRISDVNQIMDNTCENYSIVLAIVLNCHVFTQLLLRWQVTPGIKCCCSKKRYVERTVRR